MRRNDLKFYSGNTQQTWIYTCALNLDYFPQTITNKYLAVAIKFHKIGTYLALKADKMNN